MTLTVSSQITMMRHLVQSQHFRLMDISQAMRTQFRLLVLMLQLPDEQIKNGTLLETSLNNPVKLAKSIYKLMFSLENGEGSYH